MSPLDVFSFGVNVVNDEKFYFQGLVTAVSYADTINV